MIKPMPKKIHNVMSKQEQALDKNLSDVFNTIETKINTIAPTFSGKLDAATNSIETEIQKFSDAYHGSLAGQLADALNQIANFFSRW